MPRRACSREWRNFAWRRCQHANCAPTLRGEMGETISRRHPPPWWIQHKVLSMRKKHPINPPPALWALAPSLVPSDLVRAGAHSAELDARAAMALRFKGESCDLDRSPRRTGRRTRWKYVWPRSRTASRTAQSIVEKAHFSMLTLYTLKVQTLLDTVIKSISCTNITFS